MIPDIEPYNNYGGNNSNTKFDFDFFIEDTSQLSVVHIDSNGVGRNLVQEVDYSVHEFLVNEQSIIPNFENGGYIVFPLETSSYEVLKEDEKISLQLTLPIVQEAEYKNSSVLNMFNLEFSLDYLTRICQILKRQMERCIKLQEGSDLVNDKVIGNINALAEKQDEINTIINNLDEITNAQVYAENAKESAENAQSAVEEVQGVIDNVQGIIDNAQGVVDEVKQYSLEAQSAVEEAENHSLNAKTSAENALEYKDLAKSYCDDANGSKVIAISSAQLAQEKANEIYFNAEQIQTNTNKIAELEELIETGGGTGGDSSSETGAGMPVGTFFTLNCKDNYVPENCLVRDGTEYSKWQFENFWNDYLSGEISYVANKKLICPETAIIDNGILSNVQDVYYDENVTTGKEIVLKFINNDTSLTQYLFPLEGSNHYVTIIDNILGIAEFNDTQLRSDMSARRLTQSDFYIKIVSVSAPDGSSYIWEIYLSYDGSSYDFLIHWGILPDELNEYLKLKLYQCSGQIDLKNSYLKNANETSYFAQQKIESILDTCSYADYENELKTYGFCNKFAVNNIGETFRVPTAKKIERFLIDKKEATETDSSWYNLYSDGYCEQGGIVASGASTNTVHLPHSYKDKNYKVLITNSKTSSVGNYAPIYDITTNSTFIIYSNGDGTKGCNKCWHTTGYADISAYSLPKEFVVVATGQINESQYNWNDLVNGLNKVFDDTKINTPYFYGMSQYFENEPNNLSWIKGGQYYTKIVHTGYYNWLLDIYNSGVKNGKITVKAHTDTTITDYDFVINVETETFRLPLKNGEEHLPSSVFESMTLGATDTSYIAQSNGWVCVCKVVKASGQYIQIVAPSGTEPAKASTSSDWLYATKQVKRGDTYKIQYTATGETKFFRFNHAVGNGDLYYFVGETVNNTNLINAGRIEEQISNLVTIVDSYRNEASGYNIYSNGYCEQWGIVKKGSSISASGFWTVDITLLKPYINSEYVIDLTAGYGVSTSGSAGEESYYKSKTKTSFNFNLYNRNSGTAMQSDIELSWKTSGYLY